MAKVTLRYLDFSREYSTVSFNLGDPSGAAFDWSAFAGVIDTVNDAIEAVTLCTRGPESVFVELAQGSALLPADEDAQREAGLRIFYSDTVNGRKGHMTIPGPDKSIMAQQGFDEVSWADAAMVTLESAIEGNVLSRDGNAISIDKGVLVGRRN